jgi:hypothetical protein
VLDLLRFKDRGGTSRFIQILISQMVVESNPMPKSNIASFGPVILSSAAVSASLVQIPATTTSDYSNSWFVPRLGGRSGRKNILHGLVGIEWSHILGGNFRHKIVLFR